MSKIPDELRLKQITAFFGQTVEYMLRDNRLSSPFEGMTEPQKPLLSASEGQTREQAPPNPG